MGMNLKKQSFESGVDYLIAGTTIGVVSVEKEAGAAIKAKAPVALVNKKVVPVTTDNIAKVYGIVPEAAENAEKIPVYLTGEFFADALTLEASVDADALELALRNIGIFLK